MLVEMNTVWLLFNKMDYESGTVHSVYNEKPSVQTLARLIKDSFGYAYGDAESVGLALALYKNNKVRMLSNYTWELEERYVV